MERSVLFNDAASCEDYYSMVSREIKDEYGTLVK